MELEVLHKIFLVVVDKYVLKNFRRDIFNSSTKNICTYYEYKKRR